MEETRQKAPGNGHFPAVLRFIAALLLSGTLCLAWGGGNLLAQIRSIYVTIDAADASIREILESIEAQSDLRFIYADEVKPILTKVVTVREKNVSANRILDQILPDVGLQYSVGGTQVRIYQAASGSRDVAQTVSGTVISGTDNSPLAGVMIYVEGTTAGTITNGDGSYTFTIPAKSKYVTFSYVGFDTKKLHVEDTELFKLVSLAEQSNALDEVVVIGYGTQKKESMVASITSVKPSDLNITSSSLTTAFAGNIAGMISRQTSGEPGYDSASFYIRGISTFGSSNSPLIILDGVEVLSNMLNNMPPESIRVVLGAQGRPGDLGLRFARRQRRHPHQHEKRPQLGEDERLGPSGKHLLDAHDGTAGGRRRDLHAALQRGRLQHRQGDRNAPRLPAVLLGRQDQRHEGGTQQVPLSEQRLVRPDVQGFLGQPEPQPQHPRRRP